MPGQMRRFYKDSKADSDNLAKAIAHLSVTKAYAKYSGENIQIHELTEAKNEQPAHRDQQIRLPSLSIL